MSGTAWHEDGGPYACVPFESQGRFFPSPPGMRLSRGPHGLGLYATRPFAAGEVIYGTQPFVVPTDGHRYRVSVEIDGLRESVEISEMHSVKYGDVRLLDIPGCFMNHSCAPNSYSADEILADGTPTGAYRQVALVDLQPGDQITCDYVLFDWDCDGHQFTCTCGAPWCYGEIAGFAALAPAVQHWLASRISIDVARIWNEHRIDR